MAISATHYQLLKELKIRGQLPFGSDGKEVCLLEIGEANVYGDFDPHEIPGFDEPKPTEEWDFRAARLIYKELFGDYDIRSIDLHGPTAWQLDLNTVDYACEPLDVTINHGTAEHIFNISNVFRLMHDSTKTGGLMIHESPFTGWLDHGFYCLQPTLFWDLAAANGYSVVLFALEHLASKTSYKVGCRDDIHECQRRGQLADNLMCFVVFRKTSSESFKIPMQGIYAGTAGEHAAKAWRELR